MGEKIVPEIFRFVSIPFLIFEMAMSKKSCARYLQILKYAFLIFEKAMGKKIVAEIFRFVSMLF